VAQETRDAVRKTAAGLGLVVIAIVFIVALFSFWRENWGANQEPGALERFIARLLLSGSRRGNPEEQNPIAPTNENLAEGRDLYNQHCAFCHGEDGRGSGQSGVRFYPPVPSLVDAAQEMTDAQMYNVIRQGVRYTGMPSFGNALTPDQIWKITTWIHYLPANASEPSGDASSP
jgi:mono/diheme cytochrome c family protein